MKKCCELSCFARRRWKKITRVMKLTMTILLFAILTATAGSTYSQSARINLKMKDATLVDVFREIERTSEFGFFFKSEELNLSKHVSINLENASIEEILKKVLDDEYSYRILDKNIVVTRTNVNPIEQQQKTVSGKVTDSSGSPLPGVSVVLKGTTAGVITDMDGKYVISKIPEKAVLQFSFVGMKGQEVVVGNKTTIDMVLEDETVGIEEVSVVGYGVQKKKDVTTSVVGVKAKDLAGLPVNNVAEAMVGKMTGVQVLQSSGRPGESLNIKVRGVGTITAGSEPLYVIDGVPTNGTNLNSFNTNDIESIEVLKDASSAAIYGSRGSNGVILITTKQGAKGKTSINISSYTGLQQVSHKIGMLDAYQYSQMTLEARNNTYIDQMGATNRQRAANGLAPIAFSINDDNGIRLSNTGNNTNVVVPQEILPYIQGQQGLTNTDWQNEIYRTAKIQNHTIQASGGNESTRYFASLEYFDQEGIIVNSDFKRYSGRINLNSEKGIFNFGINFNPSFIKENLVNSDGTFSANGGGVVASALHYSPIWPVYNPDGSFSFAENSWSGNTVTTLPSGAKVSGNAATQAWNPVALAMLQKDEMNTARIVSNLFTEVALLKDLKYKISVGFDLLNSREDKFRPSTLPQSNTAGNPESVATGSSATSYELNWLLEQTLNYKKKIKDHSLDVLMGWSIQKDEQRSNYAFASKGFISNQITTLNAGIVTDGNSKLSQWSLASGIARLQYNYKGRYMLTTSLRADGASRFGANNKWGYFPSASVGWRMSDEEFMKGLTFISDLKVRASYGLTGNFKIPNYGALGSLAYNAYIFGGANPSSVNGAAPNSLPNPDLSWEKTAQVNLGIDGNFYDSKLTVSADLYNSNTFDLLLNVPIPMTTGNSSELRNIGKVNNKGIELNVGTKQKFGKLEWSASANYSKNINEVKELGPGNADIITTGSVGNAYFITRVGQPIGSYFLPKVLGVFKNQAEIDAYPHYIDAASNYDLATSKPGDFKFEDFDKDGKIDFNKDRQIVGNYMPKFTYGFSTEFRFRNFDLSASLQGVYGNKILNLGRRYFYNHEGNMNNYAGALNHFVSESQPGSGWNVRPNRVGKGQNGITSTWHLEDGSYLRVKNIILGYTLPPEKIRKYYMSNLRIYVSVQNPFLFTKYQGYNPEVSNRNTVTSSGEDYGVYPTAKTTSIGVNISF